MGDLASRRASVAFWTLLSGVVVTVLATVIGNLAPAALPSGLRDVLGYMALGLMALAHVLPVIAGLTRLVRPPVPLRLVPERA